MFPLLFIEVEVSFSLKDITAGAADPRQAEVNVEMHKKPEGVSYRLSDPASQEDTRATPLLLAPVAACGSFRHCHGGHGHRHHRLRQQSGGSPPPPPPEVDAAQVVTKSVRQWDEFTGRIAAIGAVDIRPRVSGYIDHIAFKEGDMVKAGDLLFVIDPRPYRATYDSAVAQLERARASAKLAEEQYKRAEALVKTAAISVDTYDTRCAALGQTSADVHAAEIAAVLTSASARL